MSGKRFFTKINKNGRNVIIDKECHIEIIDLTLACEVLNRIDLKLKTYNEQLGEQQATINKLQDENEQLRQQLQEYKENWDDMVELATKTSLRNVELDEQIGQLRKQVAECKMILRQHEFAKQEGFE